MINLFQPCFHSVITLFQPYNTNTGFSVGVAEPTLGQEAEVILKHRLAGHPYVIFDVYFHDQLSLGLTIVPMSYEKRENVIVPPPPPPSSSTVSSIPPPPTPLQGRCRE